jgi:phage terminase large subunit
MALTPAQRLIAQSPLRFRIAVCGRRFGKTHIAIRELAKFASQPDRLVWYVAPTYKQAKQIVWRKLKRRLIDLNWVAKANETELALELVNGSVIALKGADNYDSLRGVGLDFLVIDEAADIDSAAWYETLRPMLSDTAGSALFLGTPKGYNWFKDLYDRAKTRSDWITFTFTTLDGGRVSEEELAQAQQDLDARTFAQEFLATFEQYQGLVAYAFGEHNFKSRPDIQSHTPLIIGMDFNITPMSAAVLLRTQQGLHQIDEIVLNTSTTTEMIEEIRTRYPKNPITVFPDPAGVQRKTSANGNTDIKLLEMAGFTVRYHRQHPQVKDRINAANSLFHRRDDLTTRFYIDPRCKHTVKSLQNYSYKENSQIPDKGVYDHAFDALTYAIEFLFPIQKPQTYTEPERFGHRLAA